MNGPLVKPEGGFDLDDIMRAYVAGVNDANAFFNVKKCQVPTWLIERSADAYVKLVAVPLVPTS